MTGSFTNGICFPTRDEAIDTYYQSQPTFTASSGLNVYIYTYLRAVDGTWSLRGTNISGGAPSNISLSTLIFDTCDLPNDPTTNFINGMELGTAVATVCVLVFVIRKMYRGF
jgi:hypothetical protein